MNRLNPKSIAFRQLRHDGKLYQIEVCPFWLNPAETCWIAFHFWQATGNGTIASGWSEVRPDDIPRAVFAKAAAFYKQTTAPLPLLEPAP